MRRVLAEEIVKLSVEAVVKFCGVQRRVRAAISPEPYLGCNALDDVCLADLNVESLRLSVAPQTQCQRSRWRRLGAR
jgi:hypothetical protein